MPVPEEPEALVQVRFPFAAMLLGDPRTVSLEQRIFNFVQLFVFSTVLFSTVQDILAHLPMAVVLSTACCAIIGGLGLLLSRVWGIWKPMVLPIYITGLVTLVIAWHAQEGIFGSAVFYFFLLTTMAVMLFEGRGRVAALVATVGLFLCLVGLQVLRPDLVLSYHSQGQRLADLAFSACLCLIITSAMMLRFYSENQEARRKSQGLLAKVNERTRELNETVRTLADALEMAEAATKAKSQFLANMSHELRTPLNAILLFSQLIQEETGDSGTPARRADAEKIMSAGQTLLELIDSILDLSKIEAGRMTLEIRPVELAPFLDDLAAALRPLIEKGGNRFLLTPDPDLATLQTDPVRLRQILSNLLANAGKFTTGGEVELATRREGPLAVFVVRDTGIGMDPDQAGRVFDPFVQADPSTTRRFGGTGLGLALVRHLSTFLGGSVHLDSRPGRGSTFTVRLPLEPGSG